MALDRALAERWLTGYQAAWASNDPAEIGALFTEDARYLQRPWNRPWLGRQGIVAAWLAHRDEPGTYRFGGRLLALDGDLAIFVGTTAYHPGPDEPDGALYANLWLVRLAPSGQARSFEEWWMLRDESAAGEDQVGEGAGTGAFDAGGTGAGEAGSGPSGDPGSASDGAGPTSAPGATGGIEHPSGDRGPATAAGDGSER
jgi:hypothetical protein